ncbi:hypothetical protein F4775DRAFT_539404 [Biscogniauxia sp. FL1348]|nr:hypothetical protein F4775DRAFT_539404 [Biscogniauxia sp. FL1348]
MATYLRLHIGSRNLIISVQEPWLFVLGTPNLTGNLRPSLWLVYYSNIANLVHTLLLFTISFPTRSISLDRMGYGAKNLEIIVIGLALAVLAIPTLIRAVLRKRDKVLAKKQQLYRA